MMKTGNKVYALDTNVVIDLFRGEKSIADKINEAKQVYIPIPTLAELYLGAENAERKEHQLEQISTLLKVTKIINTSTQTAEEYGRLKAFLKLRGTPIPENDICEYNLPVVTRDKHFKHIPKLEILEW